MRRPRKTSTNPRPQDCQEVVDKHSQLVFLYPALPEEAQQVQTLLLSIFTLHDPRNMKITPASNAGFQWILDRLANVVWFENDDILVEFHTQDFPFCTIHNSCPMLVSAHKAVAHMNRFLTSIAFFRISPLSGGIASLYPSVSM